MNISVSQDLIAPLVDATKNIFETMISMKIEKKETRIAQDKSTLFEISGVMGITGDLTGNIALSLSKELACGAISNMMGETLTELDEIVCDGVGELINMISGDAKRILDEKNTAKFDISLPAVVKGLGHEISTSTKAVNIVVIFEAEGKHPFSIQLSLVK